MRLDFIQPGPLAPIDRGVSTVIRSNIEEASDWPFTSNFQADCVVFGTSRAALPASSNSFLSILNTTRESGSGGYFWARLFSLFPFWVRFK
jgi:hypothetical protein